MLACAPALIAQQVGPVRGDNTGDYNVTNSFETGYRFSAIDGDRGKYRSDVNYGNGVRLLGSNLTVNSRDGRGRYFDEIVLTTLGLGNDPHESATLRIQKNRLYRYDMTWRSDQYYNPGLAISLGDHFLDTTRTLQDHDLTLLPQSKIKFFLGYNHNNQNGPALTTTQLLASPLFADIRRLTNEYRLGGEIEAFGVKLNWLRRWEDFREDTPFRGDGFQRSEPYHGTSPGWLANLRTERAHWGVNGRITYTGSRRRFTLDEMSRIRQVIVTGDARRPVTAGDVAISFFPAGRLTIVNNTSVHSTRIDGNSQYLELDNATGISSALNFQFLGMRTVTNTTDAQYSISKRLAVHAGYGYSDRRVRSIEDFSPAFSITAEQSNHVHSGTAGVRLRPADSLVITLDGSIDRASHPFYPVSDRNYHELSGRAQYRRKTLLFSAAYRETYNTNSISITSFSSRARDYSAAVSWTPRSRVSFDAQYSKLHLYSISGVAFFAGPEPVSTQQLYFSNMHSGSLGVKLAPSKRVDLYLGYSITRDAGDGSGSGSAILDPFRTFPLSFQSPLARLSIRLHDRVRWNAGWQFYNYREDFGLFSVLQNYHANTGYTSVLWSF